MTYQQLLDLVNQNIKPNGNQEITGAIDNMVRFAVLNYFQTLIGSLPNLQTSVKNNLVDAINEVLNSIPQGGGGSSTVFDKMRYAEGANLAAFQSYNDRDFHLWKTLNDNKFYVSVRKSILANFENTRIQFDSDEFEFAVKSGSTASYDYFEIAAPANSYVSGESIDFNAYFALDTREHKHEISDVNNLNNVLNSKIDIGSMIDSNYVEVLDPASSPVPLQAALDYIYSQI